MPFVPNTKSPFVCVCVDGFTLGLLSPPLCVRGFTKGLPVTFVLSTLQRVVPFYCVGTVFWLSIWPEQYIRKTRDFVAKRFPVSSLFVVGSGKSRRQTNWYYVSAGLVSEKLERNGVAGLWLMASIRLWPPNDWNCFNWVTYFEMRKSWAEMCLPKIDEGFWCGMGLACGRWIVMDLLWYVSAWHRFKLEDFPLLYIII